MNGRTPAPAAAAMIITALAAAGCSSNTTAKMAGAASGTTVDVYSSLPMQGKFTVKCIQLDDSTAAAGKWDLAQVTPASTYVGLTTNLPGSAAGQPGKYYPSGTRNFLRIVPIDSIQAASDLMATIAGGHGAVAPAMFRQNCDKSL